MIGIFVNDKYVLIDYILQDKYLDYNCQSINISDENILLNNANVMLINAPIETRNIEIYKFKKYLCLDYY